MCWAIREKRYHVYINTYSEDCQEVQKMLVNYEPETVERNTFVPDEELLQEIFWTDIIERSRVSNYLNEFLELIKQNQENENK